MLWSRPFPSPATLSSNALSATLVLVAALAMAATLPGMAAAGDQRRADLRDAGQYRAGGHDRHDHRRRSTVVIGQGLPTHMPGIGTYSGGISAYRDRGNGIYFYRQGGHAPAQAPRHSHQGPRVVVPGGDAQCSNESGVCVIRPGY